MRFTQYYFIHLLSGLSAIGLLAVDVRAQSLIVPDNTLGGERSIVGTENLGLPGVPVFKTIEGGATRGSNLFHSFQLFNISSGEAAIFAPRDVGIRNILVRVTGGFSSKIEGEISSIGAPNASLFLINPSGVVFGRNSRINLGGSFIVTTADAIQLGDRGLFSAANPETSQLLNIQPSAILFGANSLSRNIELNPGSNIKVPNDRNIALVGGSIKIDQGTLSAPSGRVDVIGVLGLGQVELKLNGGLLNLNASLMTERSDVEIKNQSIIDVRSPSGGEISITGDNIRLLGGSNLGASVIAGNSALQSRLLAGNIVLDAKQAVEISDRSQLLNQLESNRDLRNGGNILIKAGSASLNGAALSTSNSGGNGQAGSIEIQASGDIRLDNESRIVGQLVGPNLNSRGNAGSIALTGNRVEIFNASRITSGTGGRGNGGNIDIQAGESIRIDGSNAKDSSGVFSQVNPGGRGNSGSISLVAPSIYLTNGGGISTRVRENGIGKAGEVLIQADQLFQLSGVGKNKLPSVISSVIEIGGFGKGGNIRIKAGQLNLDAAQILSESRNFGDAGLIELTAGDLFLTNQAVISSEIGGFGNAAGIKINVANDISLSKESLISTAVKPFAIGDSGNIQITGDSLRLASGSSLSSQSQGQGEAGSINILLNNKLIANKSNIITTTNNTAGGNIDLSANVILLRNDGNIKSNTKSGIGSGGNIFLRSGSIVLLDDSDLLAFAQDGKGGNISLFTKALLTRIYRPSEAGADLETLDKNGFVDINATGRTSGIITLPELNPLQNNRPELNQGLIDTNQAISRSCLSRDRKSGKFYITGTGGLPAKPGDPSLSTYSTLPAGSETTIAEADNLYTLANGQVVIGKACQTMGEKS